MFGSNFGTPQAQTQPTGSLFGTTGGSLFGTPSTAPVGGSLFSTPGTGATAQPFSFGSNTTNTTQAQQQQLFSTQPTATSSAQGFSFGGATTATSQPSLFGTGATTAAAPPFSFGGNTGQTGGSLFGTSTGGSLFGNQTQPTFSLQSLQSQQPGAAASQFGNQQLQYQIQQPQAQQVDPHQAFYNSIFHCNKFGDERDAILANFNYLQASLGTGKGYYSQTLPPVDYTTSNPFYRCKAVGYAHIYGNNNEDGLVSFEMKKSQDKVRAEETQFITNLQSLLGRQNIFFKIEGIKTTGDDTCSVVVFAEDRNTLRRIPATDLAQGFQNLMLQAHGKNQIQNLGIVEVQAKVRPSVEQLKRYLDTPPEGIDPRVWKKAQDDNPDPDTMIPSPIIGLDALKKRIQIQQMETEHHSTRLTIVRDECSELQTRFAGISTELQQIKRRQALLAHRLLSVIIRQEIYRKSGTIISADEERLYHRLCKIWEDLNSPSEYKGRLQELLSQIRLQPIAGSGQNYVIEDPNLYQIKEFLGTQQDSIKCLVETLKADMGEIEKVRGNPKRNNPPPQSPCTPRHF